MTDKFRTAHGTHYEDRPPLDPTTKHDDEVYMAGLIRGRELEREAVGPILVLAHDHHAFGREDCTPANCSVEAYLTEHHLGYGRG